MARLNRQELREATRKRLRDSAVQTFAREGVGGSSVDRIAEAAGFSRGAFYSNYTSKHELLLDLLASQHRQEFEFWGDTIREGDSLESIFARLETRFDDYASRQDWAMLNVEAQLEAERNAEFGEAYQIYADDLFLRSRNLIASIFAKANRVPPTDIQTLAIAMRAQTLGLTFQAVHGKSRSTLSSGALLVMFLKGMLAISPSAPDVV